MYISEGPNPGKECPYTRYENSSAKTPIFDKLKISKNRTGFPISFLFLNKKTHINSRNLAVQAKNQDGKQRERGKERGREIRERDRKKESHRHLEEEATRVTDMSVRVTHIQRKRQPAGMVACNILQHNVTHRNTLQRIATHCSTLHHTAAHCSSLSFQAGGGDQD